MKHRILPALAVLVALLIGCVAGCIIGWRMTINRGYIAVDSANPHTGYYTAFGVTDMYYIE